MTDLNHRVAANIKRYRMMMGFSQTELAKRVGVSKTSISNIERAEQSPSLELFCKIAVNLNMPPHILLKEIYYEGGHAPVLSEKDIVDERIRDIINATVASK